LLEQISEDRKLTQEESDLLDRLASLEQNRFSISDADIKKIASIKEAILTIRNQA
jgi:hypothetical protein